MRICVALFSALIFGGFASKSIKFLNVERTIDLSLHKIRASYKITASNTGLSPESSLNLIFKTAVCDSIYHIRAKQNERTIPYLKDPILSNGSSDIALSIVFANRYKPFPEQVMQNGQHAFLFFDDYYMDSIYEVVRQSTVFEIVEESIIAMTADPKIDKSRASITLPEMLNSSPFSSKEFYIHFSYRKPIFVIDRYAKVYQISEWGFISILEDFWVSNRAAMLKGAYSRFDDNQHDKQAVYSWEMRIPSSAYGIYYRDGLGNISTSSVDRHSSYKVLTLEPRFPIFGGWKTYFYVAYTIPPRSFLFKDRSQEHGKFTFSLLGSPMDDYIIQEGSIKVRLPEGATDVKVSYDDAEVSNFKRGVEHSYLDFYGRHVIEFEVLHTCKEGDGTVTITYTYDRKMLLRKPLVVSLTIFVIMCSVFLLLKMKTPILATESTESFETLSRNKEEIQTAAKNMRKLCNEFMEAVSNYKISKNMDRLRTQIHKICSKLEQKSNDIMTCFCNLRDLDPEFAKKQDHFKTKHDERVKLLNLYEEQSKKVVNGQMTREEYSKFCHPTEEQIQETNETIDKIINTL